MASRVPKADVREQVRLAAAAARELDPADRRILDLAYMSAAMDAEIPLEVKRRLSADPVAQRYAGSVIARWATSYSCGGFMRR